MAASIYSRTLQKAAELVGGRAALCKALKVPAAELQKWIEDKAKPPKNVFLRAVDLVLDETPAPGESDAADPPEALDCGPAGEPSSTRYG